MGAHDVRADVEEVLSGVAGVGQEVGAAWLFGECSVAGHGGAGEHGGVDGDVAGGGDAGHVESAAGDVVLGGSGGVQVV